MNYAQNEAILSLGGVNYSAAGTSVTTFDTRGYRYAVVDVKFGALATNGGVPAVCRITESDATVISNFTTITGGSATLAAAELAHSTVRFQIDLRKRKRYLNLDITNGTTTLVIDVVARLTRPETSKFSAAQQNVTNIASGASTNPSVNQIVRI